MNPPPSFTAEQLLEHARSLRALAKGMLGDENAAEDAVQDAWVLALEKPPMEREHAGGWLNAVVRTLALKRLRTERRRKRHEEVAARPEQVASTADSVATAALCKRLVDAVLELEDPYRSAISMRYFDDLPPREIAVRLGVPRNTVRARLQRGLAQLRARFDADSDGRRDAWAPALILFSGWKPNPIAASAAATGSSVGVLAMASIGKWVAGVVVIGALGLGLYKAKRPTDDPLVVHHTEEQPGVRTPADLATSQATIGVVPREDLTQPTVVASEGLAVAGAPPWKSSTRYPFEVRGRVVDGWGRPMRRTRLYVALGAQRFNQTEGTDPDGRFSIKFEANTANVDVHLYFRGGGDHLSGIRTVSLASGVPRELAIDLRPVARRDEFVTARRDYIGPLAEAPRYWTRPGDKLLFVSQSGLELRDFAGVEVYEDIFIEDHFEVDEEESVVRAALSGVVLTESGAPASGTLIRARLAGARFGSGTATNDKGEWKIDHLEPGTYALQAGGDDYGLAATQVEVAAGGSRVWNSRLDRGNEVRGRLLGPDGEPCTYFLRAEPVDPEVLWSDSTQSDREGRFAFPNAPNCAIRISIFDPRVNVSGIPLHIEAGHVADGRERTITIPRKALESASVSLSLAMTTGDPVPGAEVRLYHPASSRGIFLAPSDPELEPGRYSVSGLPPGNYRIEAGYPYFGWLDLGSFGLQPAGELDLGALAFPSPGTMVAACDAMSFLQTDDWRIYHEGQHVDSLAWDDFGLLPGLNDFSDLAEGEEHLLKIQLPPGDYVLATGDRQAGEGWEIGEVWFPFQIESGVESRLELPFELLSRVTLRFPASLQATAEDPIEVVVTNEANDCIVYVIGLTAKRNSKGVKLLPGTYSVVARTDSQVVAKASFEVEAARAQIVTLAE